MHKTIPNDFQVTDGVMGEFRQFLNKQQIAFTDQDMKDNSEFIKTHIDIQLVRSIFGENEADKISIENDPLVQKAIEDMPQAKELVAKAKRYMASKGQNSAPLIAGKFTVQGQGFPCPSFLAQIYEAQGAPPPYRGDDP